MPEPIAVGDAVDFTVRGVVTGFTGKHNLIVVDFPSIGKALLLRTEEVELVEEEMGN